MAKSAISFLKDIKINFIYNAAVSANKIREIDDAIYDNLRNVIYAVLPSIVYIKYERPMAKSANSQERAYLLSTAIPNSVVVHGLTKDIGEHYWVESDNICYDPTSLLEFDKEVYYVVHDVKNPQTISREDLDQMGFIKYCNRRHIADFETDPTYFKDLHSLLPFIFNSVKYKAMPEYKKEIDDYLERLGYYRKRDEKLRQDLFKKL